MNSAILKAVASYLPPQRLSNEDLCRDHPSWTPEKVFAKTGIKERSVSGADETSVDMGIQAAIALFEKNSNEKEAVDFLIFCTQTPDYFLPSSACIIQEALGLRESVGAIDVNQGCSGFVYSLSIANGLIASGSAKNVLIITADTYTKLISPSDFSVRSLFGDGATASLVKAHDGPEGLGRFVFGTSGKGANDLIVPAGGFRNPKSAKTAVVSDGGFGNKRSPEQLFMDGSKILVFGLSKVPSAVGQLLENEGISVDDVDHFVFHQASLLMLQKLGKKMKIPSEKVPIALEYSGNTVSSTIPLALEQCFLMGKFKSGDVVVLVGFGVGLSWAACTIKM